GPAPLSTGTTVRTVRTVRIPGISGTCVRTVCGRLRPLRLPTVRTTVRRIPVRFRLCGRCGRCGRSNADLSGTVVPLLVEVEPPADPPELRQEAIEAGSQAARGPRPLLLVLPNRLRDHGPERFEERAHGAFPLGLGRHEAQDRHGDRAGFEHA